MDERPRPVVGWPTNEARWASGGAEGELGRLPPPRPDRRESTLGVGDVGRLLGRERIAPRLEGDESAGDRLAAEAAGSSSSASGTESTDMNDDTLVRFGLALSGGREGVLEGLVCVRNCANGMVGDEV
jgi:hypothetical protein